MAEHTINLDGILTWCLEAIETEGWTVEDCLAHYPDYRHDLEPMLRMALRLRRAARVTPSPAFRQQAPARMQARLLRSVRVPVPISYDGVVTKRTAFRYIGQNWTLFRQWRFAMLAILVAVFVALAAGTGVVAASDGAGPGDFLFGVDLAVEDLRLRLTTDDEAESELRLKFAAERLDEAEDELTDEGDVEDIEAALTAFGEEVDAALALVDGLSPDDQATIDDAIDALLADASALGDNLEEVEFELEIEIKGGEVEIDIDFEAEGDAAADEVDDNKLAGILQAINGDQVTILTDAGPVVLQVGPNTDFKDFLAEGFRVKARQIVLPDGTLVLERIQLDNSGPGRGDDDAVVSQFKFEGTVESINADPTTGQITLTIDGQAFTLNPTSEIRDTLFAGQMFELRGAQLIDGSFVVERIELADDLGDDDLDDDDLDDDDDDDDDEHGDEHDDDDDDDDCDNSGPGNCDDDDDDDDDD